MNSIDLLLWPVAALALFSALGSGRARDWMSLGVVLGLGLLNKLSVLWLGAGIAAGLVLTPHRRVVLTPGPWIASAVAGALFLPHVAWQAAHAWPTLEFMRNATGAKMAPVSPVEFVSRQVLAVGPANLLVWLPGLAFGLFARAGRPSRILAWVYLAVALLLAVGGRSRASYLAL